MPHQPQIGDQIQVKSTHRLKGEFGKIIAIGDNPLAEVNHYHIYFEQPVFGTIGQHEIWLGLLDFYVTKPASVVQGQ